MKYSVTRKPNRKTASVAVLPDNSVTITVPEELSDEGVDQVIEKKRMWILKKKALNNEVRRPSKPKEFVSGEAFSYLGRNYRLKVEKGDKSTIKCRGGYLVVNTPETPLDGAIRGEIIDWYKKHALTKLKQRAKRYGILLDVEPKELRVSDFKRQWGSCHQDKTVIVNWRVIMAPMSIVDYVVVHELCHLRFHDHSPEFWRLLGKVLPDYQERKDWLRINGPYLEI
jgi:predicted metal-dependent hydrolase